MTTIEHCDGKLGFRIHAISFLATMALLVAINIWTSANYFWAGWVLLSWGIGLLAHWFWGRRPRPEERQRRSRHLGHRRAEALAIGAG